MLNTILFGALGCVLILFALMLIFDFGSWLTLKEGKVDRRFKTGFRANEEPVRVWLDQPSLRTKVVVGGALLFFAWVCFDENLRSHWDDIWRIGVCVVVAVISWKLYPLFLSRYERGGTSAIAFLMGRTFAALFFGIVPTLYLLNAFAPADRRVVPTNLAESREPKAVQADHPTVESVSNASPIPMETPTVSSIHERPLPEKEATQPTLAVAPIIASDERQPDQKASGSHSSPSAKNSLESGEPQRSDRTNAVNPLPNSTPEQSSGTWQGLWSCGPVLIAGARSPASFSVPLSLQIAQGTINGTRETTTTTDSFRGVVTNEGNVSITGAGRRLDDPSRNWITRFEGQVQGAKLSTIGVISTSDGLTKIRDCSLTLNLTATSSSATGQGKP